MKRSLTETNFFGNDALQNEQYVGDGKFASSEELSSRGETTDYSICLKLYVLLLAVFSDFTLNLFWTADFWPVLNDYEK